MDERHAGARNHDDVAVAVLDGADVLELDRAALDGQRLRALGDAGAVPPMWKVRRVSWVPGSPIDCAAMMPTASPTSTMRPVGVVHAVALGADALAGFAGQHRAGADHLEARRP